MLGMPKAELAADDLGVADTHDRGKAQQLHSNAALSNLASAQRQASCLKELHVALLALRQVVERAYGVSRVALDGITFPHRVETPLL